MSIMNINSGLEVSSDNPFLRAEFKRTKYNPNAYDQELQTEIIERTNREAKKIFTGCLAVGLAGVFIFAASIAGVSCIESIPRLTGILVFVGGSLGGMIGMIGITAAIQTLEVRDEQIILLQELFSRSTQMVDASTQSA